MAVDKIRPLNSQSVSPISKHARLQNAAAPIINERIRKFTKRCVTEKDIFKKCKKNAAFKILGAFGPFGGLTIIIKL